MKSIRKGEMLREFGGRKLAIHNCWRGIAVQKRHVKHHEQGMTTRNESSEQNTFVTQPAALYCHCGICLKANACAASGTVR